MNEQSTQPKRRLLLPPPHRPWLRIAVLVVLIAGSAALVWFVALQGVFSLVEPPRVPTVSDIESQSVRLIVRLAEGDTVASVVFNPDGSGIYFGQNALGEESFGELKIESSAVRSVAAAWLNGGLFMMSRDMGSEGGVSVEVFLAVGSTEHTVSCVGNCPANLTAMAEWLWAELSEDVMSKLPEFEF